MEQEGLDWGVQREDRVEVGTRDKEQKLESRKGREGWSVGNTHAKKDRG